MEHNAHVEEGDDEREVEGLRGGEGLVEEGDDEREVEGLRRGVSGRRR